MPDPIRVMVVEDHPDYRESLRLILESDSSLELLTTFGTAERALQTLENLSERRKTPDVILLDLNLPGMSGLEAIPWIRKAVADSKIIVLTQSDEEPDVLRAITSGASGYLLKSATMTDIASGIHTVMDGGASLDAGVARFILDTIQHGTSAPTKLAIQLSGRENEILILLGEGLIKKEIADQLNISPTTVATHVRHIYEKLGVANAAAAVSQAYRKGILPPVDTTNDSE